MNTEQMAKKIAEVLSAKKGEDVIRIDVSSKTSLADWFVIASGRSATQVRAMADAVEEEMKKDGVTIRRSEGVVEGRWAVLDYGDVIVHIFHDEQRLFYHLERLWTDGTTVIREEN